MNNFSAPLIINSTMTREERIEEARKSGLIGKKHDHDFAGAKYGQEIVCRKCGSRDIVVETPVQEDLEKGVEIPYVCRTCGYEGVRVGKVKAIRDNILVIDLIPDILIGLEGYGSMTGNYY